MTTPPAREPYTMQQPDGSAKPMNPLAVVSLITSILPLHLIGVVTGHIALSQIKRTGARGRGLALAGVILGYLGMVVFLIIAVLSAIAVPIFLGQQVAARDSAVQSDIINAKIAVVSRLISDPTNFPTLADLTEFVASPDTQLTLTGDAMGFCIEGYSLSNDGVSRAATHYATSDVSQTVPGTCAAGVLVPSP